MTVTVVLTAGAFETVVEEITLPAKSQVTAAQAVNVAGWLPRPPVLHLPPLFVGLAVEKLYMWSALPFAAGAIICLLIYRLNVARLAARPELREAQ